MGGGFFWLPVLEGGVSGFAAGGRSVPRGAPKKAAADSRMPMAAGAGWREAIRLKVSLRPACDRRINAL